MYISGCTLVKETATASAHIAHLNIHLNPISHCISVFSQPNYSSIRTLLKSFWNHSGLVSYKTSAGVTHGPKSIVANLPKQIWLLLPQQQRNTEPGTSLATGSKGTVLAPFHLGIEALSEGLQSVWPSGILYDLTGSDSQWSSWKTSPWPWDPLFMHKLHDPEEAS